MVPVGGIECHWSSKLRRRLYQEKTATVMRVGTRDKRATGRTQGAKTTRPSLQPLDTDVGNSEDQSSVWELAEADYTSLDAIELDTGQ